jgi:hypothetical protein
LINGELGADPLVLVALLFRPLEERELTLGNELLDEAACGLFLALPPAAFSVACS